MGNLLLFSFPILHVASSINPTIKKQERTHNKGNNTMNLYCLN